MDAFYPLDGKLYLASNFLSSIYYINLFMED